MEAQVDSDKILNIAISIITTIAIFALLFLGYCITERSYKNDLYEKRMDSLNNEVERMNRIINIQSEFINEKL